jgi:hypothetical protein
MSDFQISKAKLRKPVFIAVIGDSGQGQLEKELNKEKIPYAVKDRKVFVAKRSLSRAKRVGIEILSPTP